MRDAAPGRLRWRGGDLERDRDRDREGERPRFSAMAAVVVEEEEEDAVGGGLGGANGCRAELAGAVGAVCAGVYVCGGVCAEACVWACVCVVYVPAMACVLL